MSTAFAEQMRVVRKRTFDSNGQTTNILARVDEVMTLLRYEKFTGSLTIHMNSGGVSAMVAEDQAKPLGTT